MFRELDLLPSSGVRYYTDNFTCYLFLVVAIVGKKVGTKEK
jgi:hypothetical protein